MPVSDLEAVVAIVAGALAIAVPDRLRGPVEEERSARLAELELGAAESWFEEKRSLRAYPSPALELIRAAGLVALSLGVGLLWHRYRG